MYIAAGSGRNNLLGGGDGQGPARLAYLDSVALTDRELVNRLETARRDYSRQQALLVETLDRQEQVSADLEALVDAIYSELDAANQEYQAINQEWQRQEAERIRREEEERRRREFLATSTTAPSGGGSHRHHPAFVAHDHRPDPASGPAGDHGVPGGRGHHLPRLLGEPRPGGRGHTGVDMMSPIGTPLVAIENGVLENLNWHYAGGIGLTVKGDSGDSWYYAHLDGYAPGIQAGMRVAAGQLIGYVGETGNAAGPHLHLAHILPSGQYVNPYPVVASLC